MIANLLKNAGFEEPYTLRGANEIRVADEWYFGYDSFYGVRPELCAERPDVGMGHVMEGARAQKGFFSFNKGHWWMWQPVPVTEGRWYRGLVFVWCWSSDVDDSSKSGQTTGKLWARVGINPWGVVEPLSWGTVYGPALVAVYDKWQAYEVIAQAYRDPIAFVVDLKNEEKAKHNNWFLDAAFLHEIPPPEEWGPEEPEPEPPAPGECRGATLEQLRQELAPLMWLAR